jgi:dephospho-CoA kinase
MSVIGSSIHRIDHVGSTAVPGLPAKDLIDIQVVVDGLAVALPLAEMSRRAGFVYVAGEWYGEGRDGTKFREEVAVDADPGRPVNVNFRPRTDPVWNEALLFRDFLRADAVERDSYAEIERLLVTQNLDVDRYSELKMPYIREALMRAGTSPL